MTVPSYTHDLTTLALWALSTENWDESSDAWYDDAWAMVDDINLYYNTWTCVSAQFTKDWVGSIIYWHWSAITIPTDWAVLMWHMWAAPPALATKALWWVRLLAWDSFWDFNWWIEAWSDLDTPELIWNNYALNPWIWTPDYVVWTPTVLSYFWTAVSALAQARWNPNAMNAIRYWRCQQIYEHGNSTDWYANFLWYAVIDNALANKNALLRDIPWGYLHQWLNSMWTTTNPVEFTDSNININIWTTQNVTANFNKFEVNNTASIINWTTVNITALWTTSKWDFIVNDNAIVNKLTCTFTDMNSFTYLSNSTLDTCTYRRTWLVTQNWATFIWTTFENIINASSLLSDNLSLLTWCKFISDWSNHAVDLWTISTDTSFSWSNYITGYATSNGATWNEAIKVSVDSWITLTINVWAWYDTPNYYNTWTWTVIIQASKTLTLTWLLDWSDVVILEGWTDTVLASVDQWGTTFDYSYQTSWVTIDMWIIKPWYITKYIYGYVLKASDADYPIKQAYDRNYIT